MRFNDQSIEFTFSDVEIWIYLLINSFLPIILYSKYKQILLFRFLLSFVKIGFETHKHHHIIILIRIFFSALWSNSNYTEQQNSTL